MQHTVRSVLTPSVVIISVATSVLCHSSFFNTLWIPLHCHLAYPSPCSLPLPPLPPVTETTSSSSPPRLMFVPRYLVFPLLSLIYMPLLFLSSFLSSYHFFLSYHPFLSFLPFPPVLPPFLLELPVYCITCHHLLNLQEWVNLKRLNK